MYWSCLPIGSRSRSISMWQACSASSRGWTRFLRWRVQRLEQRGGEAAGGAEPGAGRDVGHAGDLQVAAVDARPARSASRMIGCCSSPRARDALQLRVLDDQLGHEGLVDRDVDVLVDGGRDQEAAVLAVVGRQVGAAAAERDAQRAARDDHRGVSRVGLARRSRARPARPRCRADGGRLAARSRPTKLVELARARTRSSPGYSQTVVSGGPISGSIR